MIDSGLVGATDLGRVPRGQKMLKGHLPRVTYYQVSGSTWVDPEDFDGDGIIGDICQVSFSYTSILGDT